MVVSMIIAKVIACMVIGAVLVAVTMELFNFIKRAF